MQEITQLYANILHFLINFAKYEGTRCIYIQNIP